jgi:hypothetical protein
VELEQTSASRSRGLFFSSVGNPDVNSCMLATIRSSSHWLRLISYDTHMGRSWLKSFLTAGQCSQVGRVPQQRHAAQGTPGNCAVEIYARSSLRILQMNGSSNVPCEI